jgi:hypothetical protein
LPNLGAEIAMTVVCFLAGLATLFVMGVRDWRCFAVSLLWPPVFYGAHLGAVSTLLALGVALSWRWRRSPWVAGTALGLVIAMKLFLLPVLLWLVASRRWRVASVSAVMTAVFVFVPWAAIGFQGMTRYPHVLSVLSAAEAPESLTIAATLRHFGASDLVGQIATTLAACALVVAVLRAGREKDVFMLSIVLALVVSPIVWLHYFVLLLAILPLYAPELSLVWFLPVAFLAVPITPGRASGLQTAAAMAIFAAVLGVSQLRPRVEPRRRKLGTSDLARLPAFGKQA